MGVAQQLRLAARWPSHRRRMRLLSMFCTHVPSTSHALLPGVSRDVLAARCLVRMFARARRAHGRVDLLPLLSAISEALVLDLAADVGDWTPAVPRPVPGSQQGVALGAD